MEYVEVAVIRAGTVERVCYSCTQTRIENLRVINNTKLRKIVHISEAWSYENLDAYSPMAGALKTAK